MHLLSTLPVSLSMNTPTKQKPSNKRLSQPPVVESTILARYADAGMV